MATNIEIDDAKQLVEQKIATDQGITRKEMRKLISIKRPQDTKTKFNALCNGVWSKLAVDPGYTFVRGPNKAADRMVPTNLVSETICHHGIFLCPRCRTLHEMEFRQLDPNTKKYFAACAKMHKPVFMELN